MKKLLILAPLFLFFEKTATAQLFIDSAFAVQKTELTYGSAVDFAGTARSLKLDLALPVGDDPPVCGRPLFIAIHGGGFIGGSRKDPVEQFWINDFAARGYAAASIEYRLGMFQTNLEINCNVSALGVPWNCINITDTSEWARARFRGIQDVRGAIRFLVNHKDSLHIDPQNIFIAGESAGGFIGLGIGFMDDISEKTPDCGLLPDAPAPNWIYEGPCIQNLGYSTSIAAMNLARPDLGTLDGPLNQPSEPYRVRAVASFFGAINNDLFAAQKPGPMPAVYLFHQPNDLIVPFGTNRIFEGFTNFLTGWPASCSNIVNRPFITGSKSIADLIAARADAGLPVPELTTSFTQNYADAWAQVFGPSYQNGHGIDSYKLRTGEIIDLFSKKMGPCTSSTGEKSTAAAPRIFPNPTADGRFFVEMPVGTAFFSVEIMDVAGRRVFFENRFWGDKKVEISLPEGCPSGLFFVKTNTAAGVFLTKISKL